MERVNNYFFRIFLPSLAFPDIDKRRNSLEELLIHELARTVILKLWEGQEQLPFLKRGKFNFILAITRFPSKTKQIHFKAKGFCFFPLLQACTCTHSSKYCEQRDAYILGICSFLSYQTCVKVLEFMKRLDWESS